MTKFKFAFELLNTGTDTKTSIFWHVKNTGHFPRSRKIRQID